MNLKNIFKRKLNQTEKKKHSDLLENPIFQKIMKFSLSSLLLIIEIFVVMWIVITIVFFLVNSTPGSSEITSGATNQVSKDILIHKYGLDRPIMARYWIYLGNLLRGDFGVSNVLFPGQEINSFIWTRFFTSFTVGGIVLVLTYILMFPIGMFVGQYQGKWPDTVASIFVAIVVAIPSLVLGLLFLILGRKLGLPYIYDMKDFATYILPVMVLTVGGVAAGIKTIRVSIIDEMTSNYAKFAYLKGCSKRRFVWRHAIRPASFLIISTLPTAVIGSFIGSMFIEKIFQIPGSGQLMIGAIQSKDYNIILFLTAMFTFITVISFKIRDIMYRLLDPRMRKGR